MSSRTAGYLLTAITWLLLLASATLLPRADDYFYTVDANLLYQYQPIGAILITILIALIPLTILAIRGSWAAGLTVTLLWLLALVLCVWSAFHLGTHPTDYSPAAKNTVEAGTVFSITASAAGFLTALFTAPPRHST
jgi:hypothetical protein